MASKAAVDAGKAGLERPDGVAAWPAPRALTQALPKRRLPFAVMPQDVDLGLEGVKRSFALTDAIFERAGLTQYIGCSSYEPEVRPCISVRHTSNEALEAMCAKWIPLIINRIRARARVIRSYSLDARSKLGSPVRKVVDDKVAVITPWLEQAARGDFSIAEQDGAALQGIRLQPEATTKTRHCLAVRSDGQAYAYTADLERRTDPVTGRVASRVRNVINPSVLNHAKGPASKVIHNTQLQWASHKPDYAGMRSKGFDVELLVALDWKNFDHQVSAAHKYYGPCISEDYARLNDILRAQPVVCLSDDRREAVYTQAKEGFEEQFRSGDADVAPFDKAAAQSPMCEFLQREFGLSKESVLDVLETGEYRGFIFRNYGDDGIIGGPKRTVMRCVAFFSTVADIEIEDPPRYLGEIFRRDPDGVWRCGMNWKSLLLKWYLAERPPFSVFRRFPNLGWVERRMDYQRYGGPGTDKALALELDVLSAHGYDVNHIYAASRKEAEEARAGGAANVDYTLRFEKSYMLTEEEKLGLPEYQQLPPELLSSLLSTFLKGWNLRT